MLGDAESDVRRTTLARPGGIARRWDTHASGFVVLPLCPVIAASNTTLCDRLVSYQLLDPTSSTDAQGVMGRLFNRGVRGTEGSTDGGAIADPSMDAIWSGAVQYRENTTVPQPFANQGPTPNYQTDSAAKDALADKWRKWLGSPSALHCTAAGYPAYSTTALGFGTFNLYQVHANMVITAAQFAAFNNHLTTAFHSMGELQPTIDDDVAEFAALLNSFARCQVGGVQAANEICTAQGCPCAPGVQGADCDQLPAPPASAQSSTAPAGGSVTPPPAGGDASTAPAEPPANGGGSVPSSPGSDTTTPPPVGQDVIGSSTASPAPGLTPSTGAHMSSTGRPCIRGVDALCAATMSAPSVIVSSVLLVLGAFRFGF